MEKDLNQTSYNSGDQNLTETWINSEQMNTLPPEVQDKVKNAMRQLGSNPDIMNMLKMGLNMSREANKNGGVFVKTFTMNNQQPTISTTVAEATPVLAPQTQTHRPTQAPITFNPDVKSDHWRRQILIIGLLILAGYLIYKYGPQFGLNF